METSLSIGFVSPGWPQDAFTNGIVTYVATVVPHLRALGHRISILAGNTAGTTDTDAVFDASRVHAERSAARRIVESAWYRLAKESAIRHLTRRPITVGAQRMTVARGLQLIEMEESFGWARWVRRAASIPVCVRLHGPWFLSGPAGGVTDDDVFRRRVRDEGRAIAAADAVTAPARDVLDRVRKFYELELRDAEVIPNPTAPVVMHERWTLPGCDSKRVIFIGRFDRLKGGDLIVDAFARLRRDVPDARLTLVGPDSGCRTDDGRTWALEEYVRDRIPGALESGQVEWLGRQPFSALARLRRRALVTVICSRYENFPNTATEAMAMGCPVVAARTAGIPEIVRDGVNGLLHETGDAADLAAKIQALMQNPARAAALGNQAALDCERLLYPSVIASRLVALYRTIAERNAV